MAATLPCTCRHTSSEIEMPLGSAIPSSRAATLTPSPKMSSPWMMTSPDVYSDPELDRIAFGLASIPLTNLSLNFDRADDGVHGACEFNKSAIPHKFDNAAIVGSITSRLKAFKRASVPASSIPMRREYPTTSADSIAASLLWRRSSAMQARLTRPPVGASLWIKGCGVHCDAGDPFGA